MDVMSPDETRQAPLLAGAPRRTYAPRMMLKRTRNLMCAALGATIGMSIALAGGVLADKPTGLGQDLPWQDARMLAEVLDRVEHDYVNPVDDHQLLQAAIRGMVS